MLISTKNGKTGIVRAIALAICVVMLVAFAAGCSDEHAQSLANAAQTAADQAAEAAKQAQEAAKQAQGTADQAIKDAASANSNANSKFTEAQVEAAILEILKDYVKAEDAATKAELEDVSKQLANYLTEDAVKALISAAAASKDDLDAAKEEILDEVSKIVTNLEGYYNKSAIDAFLAKYYTSEEIDTALADYYVKSKVDELVAGAIDPTELAAAIGTSEEEVKELIATYVDPTELATELAKYYTKTEIDAKFLANEEAMKEFVEEQLKSYVTKDELAGELQFLSGELNALGGQLRQLQSKLIETADKTLADAEAYARSLVEAYNDLTPVVAEKYLELLAHQEAYIDANGYLYDAEGLKAVYNKYNYATVLLIRATSQEAIDAVMDIVKESVDGVDTILDQLYDALVAVEATKIEGINGEKYIAIATGTFTEDSGAAIDECLALLDKALANGITVEELNAYPEMALETATKAYDAEYTRLENAKYAADNSVYAQAVVYDANRTYYKLEGGVYTAVAAAEVNDTNYSNYYVVEKTAVNNLVNALEDWAEYKKEETVKTVEALYAKLSAAEVAYYAWMDEYFEAYEDEANPNIARLIPGWATTYKDASNHWAVLAGIDELIEDYLAKINDLLGESKTGWDKNDTVLYTWLETITALVTELEADDDTYGFISVYPDLKTRYEDLLAAEEYADAANDLYLAFIDETSGKSVYGYLVDLVALDREITNYKQYGICMETYNAWFFDATTGYPNTDEANRLAIVNSNEATPDLDNEVAAASARFVQLKQAAEMAEEIINPAIDAFYDAEGNVKVTYKDMDALEALWYSINGKPATETEPAVKGWLQIFDIPSDPRANGYFASNYNMVDHDKLIAALEACQNVIGEILADPDVIAFSGMIAALQETWFEDDYQLYYYNDYVTARNLYTTWANRWEINDITLETFNGGTQQGEVDNIGALFKFLNTVGTAVENELKVAIETDTINGVKYAIFNTEMAKFADGDYKPALVGSEWVVDAWTVADLWVKTHIDFQTEGRGFNDVIKSIDGLFTEDEYVIVKAVYEEYAAYVATAKAELETLFAELSDYFTLTEGVYDFNITLITDVLPLETLEGKYTGTEGWLAAYAVTDEANITDADLKALAQQFDADLTAVMTELNALKASYEADLAALDFDNKLLALESGTLTIYSNYVGDLADLRAAYNAFADKYFLGNNSSEAFANSMQFTALNIYVKRLEALEAQVRLLEDAKKADANEFIAAVEAILAGGVTTDDYQAIVDALDMFAEWSANIDTTYETMFDGIYLTGELLGANGDLVDAKASIDEIMDLLETAKDAIADLGAAESPAINYTDKTALDAYKALYDAAVAAVEAFKTANGSLGTTTLADEYRITEAEQAIIANAKVEIDSYGYLCKAYEAYNEAYGKYIADQGLDLEDEFKVELEATIANIKGLVASGAADTTVQAATDRLASELDTIVKEAGNIGGSEAPDPDDTDPDIYPEGTNP
ncbi:MAG: hypothetical protein IJX46_02980 [Clostridia bacterium]|nr:hypothetical protein [Clostridia bacterium]